MRRFALAVVLFLAGILPAAAQSGCSYIVTGAVLTAAQWNSCFAAKQNVLTYTPVNKAGDTMLGRLTMTPSTSVSAGINVSPGTAPSSPNNGDMWTTTAGLFVRINGTTVGPITGGASGSFAATAPLVVTFPSSVVTYALASQSANTVLGSATASIPTALAVPSCSTSVSTLIWTASTGFGCNTFGTAALAATGTSGHVLGFLDGNNGWTGRNVFGAASTAISSGQLITHAATNRNIVLTNSSVVTGPAIVAVNDTGLQQTELEISALGTRFTVGRPSGAVYATPTVGTPNQAISSYQYGPSGNTTIAVSTVTNNGSGGIRITVPSTDLMAANHPYPDTGLYGSSPGVNVYGVGGVTAANGHFHYTIINGTQFDLIGPTFSGAYTSGGTVGFQINFNRQQVAFDDINPGLGDTVNMFRWDYNCCGPNNEGGRAVLQSQFNFTSPAKLGSLNPSSYNWTGIASYVDVLANPGGTNTGAGALGGFFASNFVVRTGGAFTNIAGLVGGEVDIVMDAASTVRDRLGWSVVAFGQGFGANSDMAYELGATSALTAWKIGYGFSDGHGAQPLATDGCMMCVHVAAGFGPYTIAKGIDATGFSLTGNFLTSSGFSVGPTGNTVVNNLTVNGTFPLIPISGGGTSQTTAAAARGGSGLNVFGLTLHGDSNYTILSTDRTVSTSATFTAPRTWTLPAATSIASGDQVCVADFNGGISSANTLLIARGGADTINGAVGTYVLSNARAGQCFKTDGISNWSTNIHGVVAGGTGVTSGNSGGILYYNTTLTMAASATLGTNQLVLGGGSGGAPATLGSLGTVTTVLHGNAGGAPTFGAVDLAADVTGVLLGVNGGTGIANSGKTITLGGNLTTSGAFAATFTLTGTTGVTFPTTGTLSTLAGSEAFTNKTYNGNTWTAGTGVLTLGAGITATISNTLTFTGTNGSSVAFGAGGTVIYSGGALGTPSSGTLTNATGLPIGSGVSGLGTGVATALAINVGTAGAPVVLNGALGSPSSVGTLPAHTLGGTISGGGNQINNVIIGTTTPLAGSFTTLNASGTATFAGGTTINGSGDYINATTGSHYIGATHASGALLFLSGDGSTTRLSISGTSILLPTIASTAQSNILCFNSGTGAVTYQTYASGCVVSSSRFKQDIKPMTTLDALKTVLAIEPVYFKYKKETDLDYDRHTGFIAEQVEKVDRELVMFDDKGLAYSVKNQEMNAHLVAAIQEQQRQINDLRAALKGSPK